MPPRTSHPTSPTTPPTCPAGHSAPAEHPQPETTQRSHRSAARTASASPEKNTPPAKSAPRSTTPSSAGEHEHAPPQSPKKAYDQQRSPEHPECGDQQSADCTVATRSAPPAPPGTPQSGQSRVPRPTEPFVPLLHKLHVPTRGMRGHLTPHRTRLILEQVHPDERRIHPTRHRLERLDQRTRVLGLGKPGRQLPPRRGSDLTHRGPVPVVPFDLQTERLLRKMDRLPDNLHPPPEAKSLPVIGQLSAPPAASTCHQLLHDPRRTQRIIMTPRKQLLIPLRVLGRQCPLNHIRPRQRPTGEQQIGRASCRDRG